MKLNFSMMTLPDFKPSSNELSNRGDRFVKFMLLIFTN